MQSDLLNLYNTKSRHFRVFYHVLEEDGCQPSDLNEGSQIVFPKDNFLHPKNSIFPSPSSSLETESSQGSLYESELFKW
jgi:hypothetical protein